MRSAFVTLGLRHRQTYNALFSTAVLLLFNGCARTTCSIDPQLFDRVSKIRGIVRTSDVPCRRLSRPQIRTELDSIFRAKADPKRMYWEGETFKALKIIPEGFRYPEQVLDFYSEELLALYEPDEKQIIIGIRSNQPVDDGLLAHELTHALQDQRYDVNSIIDYSLSNDEMTARSALLEGDANVTAGLFGGALRCSTRPRDDLYRQIAAIQNTPGRFPPSLEMITAFPYLFGERFACTVRNHGGVNALERTYRLLPLTSREIAFPVEYFSRVEKNSSVTDSSAGNDGEKGDTHIDSLGEFLLFVVLIPTTPIDESISLSEAWKSDRLEIKTSDPQPTLRWAIEFQSAALANRAAAALRQNFEGADVVQAGQVVVLSLAIRSPIPRKFR